MAKANLIGTSCAPFTCNGVITANHFVKVHTTAGQVIKSDAIADLSIGVAQGTTAAPGTQLAVQMYGVAKAVLGTGGATVGQELMVIAGESGAVGPASGPTAVTVCVALEAGASGSTVAVLLKTPCGKRPANT